ncbi:hypothetical protein GW17_00052603 [Ensete ventricosum]|nr:hypothetical protein GW17_00052603 [Ensete ventricosum]RZR93727.1 hypothetical protein BHM03_00022290 [Ensete ventricosum]
MGVMPVGPPLRASNAAVGTFGCRRLLLQVAWPLLVASTRALAAPGHPCKQPGRRWLPLQGSWPRAAAPASKPSCKWLHPSSMPLLRITTTNE